MNISLSFIRIQFSITFLVICILIGFVGNVFASPYSEAKCRNVIYSYSPVFIEYGSETWEVLSDGSFKTNSSDQNHKEGYLVHLKSVYSNGGGWRVYRYTAVYVFSLGEGKNISLADLDPCIDCSNKAEELTEQCGGTEGQAWKWTDKEQCKGQCIDKCNKKKGEKINVLLSTGLCIDRCSIKLLSKFELYLLTLKNNFIMRNIQVILVF